MAPLGRLGGAIITAEAFKLLVAATALVRLDLPRDVFAYALLGSHRA